MFKKKNWFGRKIVLNFVLSLCQIQFREGCDNIVYNFVLKIGKCLRNEFIFGKICILSLFRMEDNRLIIKERLNK